MIVQRDQIRNLLDQLAQHFESEVQTHDQFAACSGWGQFLDTAKLHKQIGPYGTAGGLIVLTLAGRGADTLTKQAACLLENWWTSYKADRSQYFLPRAIQNPRLAFMSLALRLANTPAQRIVLQEVEKALFDRLLTSGMWSDYWYSETLHDQTPRLFCSAICLLSFTLLRHEVLPLDNRLVVVADLLEEKLATTKNLPLFHSVAIGAAVLSAKKDSLNREALAKLDDLALAGSRGLGERAVYFYDYEYNSKDDKKQFDRDYFFIPVDIVIALAGFQTGAPAGMRILAESILGHLIENITENGGVYRPGAGERLSSVDQAWAALLLKTSISQSTWPHMASSVRYWLYRQRKGNWITNTAFPILSLLFVTVSNVFLKDAGLVASSLAAIALLIVSGLYGKEMFRKVVGLVK
jgi:hypothetical protein